MTSSIDLLKTYSESGVAEVLESLEKELVGLRPVKTRIKEIAALLFIDKAREELGLPCSKPNLHMSFTGKPGTGKTTVARRISEILYKLGYLKKGHLITATRDDLVGQYVGHTAPRTKEIILRAKGGVLFIDEAYYLHKPSNDRDYGVEAIEILLQEMETKRDEFVVIFAGYKEKMEQFYNSNPGLSSRVSHHIDFPDYTNSELMEIALLFLDKEGYKFTENSISTFTKYIQKRRQLPFFANARSIRNAIDRARLRQANRIFSQMGESLDREELMRIESPDILASSVFNGELED